MKALFYPSYGKLVVNDQPLPAYNDDEVLLRVSACGICGSELETFRNKSPRRTPPLIMGHEFCGEIVKTGASVTDWKVGMHVVGNSVIPCGRCNRCQEGKTNLCKDRQVFGMERNGAFAEYVNVPAHCLFPIPENVSPEAACLAEPLGNGVHMVGLTKHNIVKRVLVIGAGPIGLMAQQAFQALRSASVIVTDLKEERLETARKLGAEFTINTGREKLNEKMPELIGDDDIDVVVDAVGLKNTQQTALHMVRPGGSVILIGLHENGYALRSYDIILPEKQVLGTYAATMEDIRGALKLMEEGTVDVTSWVDYYPLDDGEAAFNDMLTAKGNHIKSVLLMKETR